jgi:hypothetical protein
MYRDGVSTEKIRSIVPDYSMDKIRKMIKIGGYLDPQLIPFVKEGSSSLPVSAAVELANFVRSEQIIIWNQYKDESGKADIFKKLIKTKKHKSYNRVIEDLVGKKAETIDLALESKIEFENYVTQAGKFLESWCLDRKISSKELIRALHSRSTN